MTARLALSVALSLVVVDAAAADTVGSHDELKALRAAAQHGDPAARLALGEALDTIGLHDVSGNASSWFVEAAEMGYAPAFEHALDALLFHAGDKADVVKAKHVADLARKQDVADVRGLLDTVDRCYRAGDQEVRFQEEAARIEALVEDVQALQAKPPPADRGFASADRELNALWSKLMKSKDLFRPKGSIDRDALRRAQRSWIAYRGAWARVGSAFHPRSSVAAWKTRLTRVRIEELGSY